MAWHLRRNGESLTLPRVSARAVVSKPNLWWRRAAVHGSNMAVDVAYASVGFGAARPWTRQNLCEKDGSDHQQRGFSSRGDTHPCKGGRIVCKASVRTPRQGARPGRGLTGITRSNSTTASSCGTCALAGGGRLTALGTGGIRVVTLVACGRLGSDRPKLQG